MQFSIDAKVIVFRQSHMFLEFEDVLYCSYIIERGEVNGKEERG
jgi:hypothetical protein